jgi:hypothetical protein
MTTSIEHKSEQALRGEKKIKQTEQINEYDFFVSTSCLESDEVLKKEKVKKIEADRGVVKPDQSAVFFLPD